MIKAKLTKANNCQMRLNTCFCFLLSANILLDFSNEIKWTRSEMKAGARTGPGRKHTPAAELWHRLWRDAALPLVDCKWQSKFTQTAGAGMGSDSFVRESERLSGSAGIWMISPPFHLQNRRCTFNEPSMATHARVHEHTHAHTKWKSEKLNWLASSLGMASLQKREKLLSKEERDWRGRGGWQTKEFELVAEQTRQETLAASRTTLTLIILALDCLTSPLSSFRWKLFRRIR